MAIEAAKQVADDVDLIHAFELRDATFQKSLVIPSDSEGAQISFGLRRLMNRPNCYSSWSEFILSSHSGGQWSENCRGNINVEVSSTSVMSENLVENSMELTGYQRHVQSATENCTTHLKAFSIYECFWKCGLDYGPSFQRLQQAFTDNSDQVVSKIQLHQHDAHAHAISLNDYVARPTTLGAILHTLYVGLTQGCTRSISTSVPTAIRKLWVSNNGLGHSQDSEVNVVTQLSHPSLLSTSSSLFALSATNDAVRVAADGIEMTDVVGTRHSSQVTSLEVQRYHQLLWKSDISVMDQMQVARYLRHEHSDEEPEHFFEDLTLLLLMFVSSTLAKLPHLKLDGLKSHHRKYISWMQKVESQYQANELPDASPLWKDSLSDSIYRDQLSDQIGNSSAKGKLFVEVGRNLANILEQKIDIHEIIFQSRIAEDIYQELYGVPSLKHPYSKYLDAAAHKNPTMRILEIGAGTGGATAIILDILCASDDSSRAPPRYKQYDFTDISPSFFEKARSRFPGQAARINFKLFDVDDDPANQVSNLEPTIWSLRLAPFILRRT